jgi:RNA polymerase sigma-70 factor (ECF subfamily)
VETVLSQAEVQVRRSGGPATIRALYVQHHAVLLAAVRRLTWPGCDVEDLLHEVFVIALRRSATADVAELSKAWLYGVTIKVAAAARRRHLLRTFLGLDETDELASETATPDATLEEREVCAGVHRALSKLSGKKREVLVLFELQGLSGPEIAEALGCPLKTVWTRLHHGRKDFERQMVRHG